MSYHLVCIQEALPVHQYQGLGPQSKTNTFCFIKMDSYSINGLHLRADKCLYLVPGHGLCSEKRAGKFHRKTFLVVLRLIFRHAEQHCCSICGYIEKSTWERVKINGNLECPRPLPLFSWQHKPPEKVIVKTCPLILREFLCYNAVWYLSIGGSHSPTPSFLECSSSVRGAVAPSASMASAASLSWASSHNTPAATRWMFSIGEYSSYKARDTL